MASPAGDAVHSDASLLPEHDRSVVARVILEEAVELHPERLSVEALAQRVIPKRGDERALETADLAIGDLKEFGLLQEQNGLAEPTNTALHAVTLLGVLAK